MAGPVEQAVRRALTAGDELPTPTGRVTFVVDTIDSDGVVLLFGPRKTATHFTWDCLEGIPGYVGRRGRIPVGANRILPGEQGTLDGYLKDHLARQTANYVAVLLDRCGVLNLDPTPQASVQARPTM